MSKVHIGPHTDPEVRDHYFYEKLWDFAPKRCNVKCDVGKSGHWEVQLNRSEAEPVRIGIGKVNPLLVPNVMHMAGCKHFDSSIAEYMTKEPRGWLVRHYLCRQGIGINCRNSYPLYL